MYDKILDLRIATPQIIMNYGLFLEENNYFEEAFKVLNLFLMDIYVNNVNEIKNFLSSVARLILNYMY